MGPLLLMLVVFAAEPTLHIETVPPGAALTIDGALVGLSPRTETLTPGVHTLTADLGGATTSQTISLFDGEARKLTLSLIASRPPRPAPVAGLVTLGGGALAFGLGLLLQVPAREAGNQVKLLFERGGGWDDGARKLEDNGLSAQNWSWFFTGAGLAVMASGLVVCGIQLFGHRSELPMLVLLPTRDGALAAWGTRW